MTWKWLWASMRPGVSARPARSHLVGLRPGQGTDLVVGAHGLDATVLDGHGLGDGVGGIDGDDLAVGQDQVGGAVEGLWGGRRCGRRRVGDDGYCGRFGWGAWCRGWGGRLYSLSATTATSQGGHGQAAQAEAGGL